MDNEGSRIRIIVGNTFLSMGPIPSDTARKWRGLGEGVREDFGIRITTQNHSEESSSGLLDLKPNETALTLYGDHLHMLPFLERLQMAEERRETRLVRRLRG